MTTPIKLALVDDHTLMRDSLAQKISETDDIRVIFLAKNGRDFIEKIGAQERPDLVLLDLNMPEMNGFETAKWIRENNPEIKVVILTMHDSETGILQLLQLGVRGFLRKDIPKFALMAVHRAGFYYNQTATGRLINLFKSDGFKNSTIQNVMISPGELSFLKLVSSELTYKEIAVKLKISPRTVDNYRDALFLKLNVRSRVGLAMYAVKSGIVPIA